MKSLHNVVIRSEHVDESHLWHFRYGHLNYNGLQQLKQKNMVSGLPSIQNQTGICEGYVYEKMHHFSFTKTTWRTNTPLELIHADICGPIRTPSISNNRYFLLFVDDYFRMIWIYLLDKKSEAFSIFFSIQNSCKKTKWVPDEYSKDRS
jgi:hypothetical protein